MSGDKPTVQKISKVSGALSYPGILETWRAFIVKWGDLGYRLSQTRASLEHPIKIIHKSSSSEIPVVENVKWATTEVKSLFSAKQHPIEQQMDATLEQFLDSPNYDSIKNHKPPTSDIPNDIGYICGPI